MIGKSVYAAAPEGLSDGQIRKELEHSLSDVRAKLKKVLILPPDYTRFHSNAGRITQILYEMLKDDCQVDIMPALGTHVPVSESEWNHMFAGIPYEKMIVHSWRNDVTKVGVVPAEFVSEVSEGLVNDPIDV